MGTDVGMAVSAANTDTLLLAKSSRHFLCADGRGVK